MVLLDSTNLGGDLVSNYSNNKVDLSNVRLEIERIFGDGSFILDDDYCTDNENEVNNFSKDYVNDNLITKNEKTSNQIEVLDLDDENLDDINSNFNSSNDLSVRLENESVVNIKLAELGISIINQSSKQFEIEIINSKLNFNFIALLLNSFIGEKSLDILIAKKMDSAIIKIRNFCEHDVVFNNDDFLKYIFNIINSFDDNDNSYLEQLTHYSNLMGIFRLFEEAFLHQGNIKIGYKRRNKLDYFAIMTNQQFLIDIIKKCDIEMKNIDDYSQIVLKNGDGKLKLILSHITNEVSEVLINDDDSSTKDDSRILSVTKKTTINQELGETAQVNPTLLVMVTIFELVAVCLSMYFLYR